LRTNKRRGEASFFCGFEISFRLQLVGHGIFYSFSCVG